MLPASRRVRRRRDFAAALGGYRAGGRLVTVHMALPEPLDGNERTGTVRVGFVVSKAVGKAVARNAVKRRLRHLIAARIDLFPPGALVVVRASQGAASASAGELAQALDEAISRLLRSPHSGRPVGARQ